MHVHACIAHKLSLQRSGEPVCLLQGNITVDVAQLLQQWFEPAQLQSACLWQAGKWEKENAGIAAVGVVRLGRLTSRNSAWEWKHTAGTKQELL